jgi:hypothetical protein
MHVRRIMHFISSQRAELAADNIYRGYRVSLIAETGQL